MVEIAPPLRDHLALPYSELKERNLKIKQSELDPKEQELERREELKDKRIKAVTLFYSDIEGKLHWCDYDKDFFLESADNLTFDGSSVRGLSSQDESDLRLAADWSSFRWPPSDVFGEGKVLMFADIQDRDHNPYPTDFRGQLRALTQTMREEGVTANVSAEIEGYLVAGIDAEQNFQEEHGFELISTGGYYNALPLSPLRRFIDTAAEVQRAMGFENEKDHPEVGPGQFELNFKYADVVQASDQAQLYKYICRQIATSRGMTATFLPKPAMDINGSGMHTNLSLSENGKNTFYDREGEEGLSDSAHSAISKILNHAPELSLIFNPSVNAYRRLDPHFEAPNQIKVSPNDRGSMIRIPTGNERSARLEIRSVAPDANPYLVNYVILRTIREGKELPSDEDKRHRTRTLPVDIYEAIEDFKKGELIRTIFDATSLKKYADWKEKAAHRSPREFGETVKSSEVLYHHEVTNQLIWSRF